MRHRRARRVSPIARALAAWALLGVLGFALGALGGLVAHYAWGWSR